MKKSQYYSEILDIIETHLMTDGVKGKVTQEQEYLNDAWRYLRFAKEIAKFDEEISFFKKNDVVLVLDKNGVICNEPFYQIVDVYDENFCIISQLGGKRNWSYVWKIKNLVKVMDYVG